MSDPSDHGGKNPAGERAGALLNELLQEAKREVQKERSGQPASQASSPVTQPEPKPEELRRREEMQRVVAEESRRRHDGPPRREDSASAPWPKPVTQDSFLMAFGPQPQRRSFFVGLGLVAGLVAGGGATALLSPAMGAPPAEIVLPDMNDRAGQIVDQARLTWEARQADARVAAAEKKAQDAEGQVKVESQLRAAVEKAKTDLEAELIKTKALLAAAQAAPAAAPAAPQVAEDPAKDVKKNGSNGGAKRGTNGGLGIDTSVFKTN